MLNYLSSVDTRGLCLASPPNIFFFISHMLIIDWSINNGYVNMSHWLREFTDIQQVVVIHVNLPAGAFFSRFWGSLPSLPSNFKIFRPWKKSSTIKSWPTFCDQYFWKFPIWNSHADEKRREIRLVKVNVIFNDIRLLICLTPLQVNWVMVIN